MVAVFSDRWSLLHSSESLMYLSKHQKTIRETSTIKNPYRIPNLHAPRSNFRFPKQQSLSRGSSRNSKTDCCELPKKPPALRKQSTNTQHQSCPILRDVETIIRSRQVPSFLTSKSTSTDTQTRGTGKRANYSIDWFANEQGEEEPPAAGWPGLVVSKNYTFLVQWGRACCCCRGPDVAVCCGGMRKTLLSAIWMLRVAVFLPLLLRSLLGCDRFFFTVLFSKILPE